MHADIENKRAGANASSPTGSRGRRWQSLPVPQRRCSALLAALLAGCSEVPVDTDKRGLLRYEFLETGGRRFLRRGGDYGRDGGISRRVTACRRILRFVQLLGTALA